ncbi:Myelin-oligodendrocyte glycoprotein [Oryzias melastigma]|uniref:Myelin-oligodendrocyte glycoprotein n=1 Tax=Oryzias melastigma TaxID=30732 RepID=A0A834F7A7_ORYME|nr:Myelin-oligodendrocyte glycoprotein [Oryzias melastigma]
MSESDSEFLEDDGTQNYVVQENPAVFTGSLSVTAAPDEGQNQEPFHQDGSVSPPGSPNWSEAPAGDFRPDSPAAAAINDEPGEAAGQPEPPQIQTWVPDLRPPRYLWVNHGRSPGSRLAKPKASARRGRTRPTLGVAPRREVQTTMVALKNQRRGSVHNDAGGVSEDPPCVDMARERFHWPRAFKLVCSPPTVQTEPGQDVVLSCSVEPPFDLTAQTVEWSRDTDVIVHVYRSRADNQFLQNQKLRGRTVLIHQNLKDGKVSLRLINITKEDEGNYSCCLPNHEVQSSVTLTVAVPNKLKR